MKGLRHIGPLVLKGTFLVIGLMLFTAQESYKYYRYASMPAFHMSARTNALSACPIPYDANKKPRLTLDKRFDVEAVLALLTPVFVFSFFSRSVRLPAFYPDARLVINKQFLDPQRGPPGILLL